MLYIPKIGDYLKIFTNEEVKDFVATNFCECFKSIRQKLYSKLNKKQNFRKNAKLLYNDEVEKFGEIMQSHSSDNCVHRYNIKILNLFNPEF